MTILVSDKLNEDLLTIKRLLTEIINVLGPDPTDCPVNQCEGCRVEMIEALNRAKQALDLFSKEV